MATIQYRWTVSARGNPYVQLLLPHDRRGLARLLVAEHDVVWLGSRAFDEQAFTQIGEAFGEARRFLLGLKES